MIFISAARSRLGSPEKIRNNYENEFIGNFVLFFGILNLKSEIFMFIFGILGGGNILIDNCKNSNDSK